MYNKASLQVFLQNVIQHPLKYTEKNKKHHVDLLKAVVGSRTASDGTEGRWGSKRSFVKE